VEGLLAASVAAGALPVEDGQRDQVRGAARGRARVDLCLERELLGTAAILDGAGVAYRTLKGPAWAHTVYPDPSWRGFGDVDLLLDGRDWYRAVEALEASGVRRLLPEVRPGFDRRFGKDATLLSGSGWELDLHRTLVAGPYGLWRDPAELFDAPSTARIGGVDVPVLGPEVSFLHACYNAALADDPPRLIALRDVCQMALAGSADPAGVGDLARRWRAGAVVARAIDLAAGVLGPAVLESDVAAAFLDTPVAPWDRVLMASYRGPGRGYTSQAAAVVAMRGLGERAAYLWALTRPQGSYLSARGLSPMAHVGRGARRVWGGR
ncbi:MAG: nucleotidyltransferase family protein, partial [Acidimicrobiales bacterium]